MIYYFCVRISSRTKKNNIRIHLFHKICWYIKYQVTIKKESLGLLPRFVFVVGFSKIKQGLHGFFLFGSCLVFGSRVTRTKKWRNVLWNWGFKKEEMWGWACKWCDPWGVMWLVEINNGRLWLVWKSWRVSCVCLRGVVFLLWVCLWVKVGRKKFSSYCGRNGQS